jgi:mono/diheme cytochrome c family protein
MRAFLFVGILVAAVSTSAAAQADGKALYDAQCKKCHGALGTPNKVMGTKFPKMLPFNDAKAGTAKGTAADVVTILTKGKGADMKPFADKLKPDEMSAVAKYVLELAKPKS